MDQHGTWNTPQMRTAAPTHRGGGVSSVLAQLFAPRSQEIYIQQHWIFSPRSSNLRIYGRNYR